MDNAESQKCLDGLTAMSLMENPVFTVQVDYSRIDLILRSLTSQLASTQKKVEQNSVRMDRMDSEIDNTKDMIWKELYGGNDKRSEFIKNMKESSTATEYCFGRD